MFASHRHVALTALILLTSNYVDSFVPSKNLHGRRSTVSSLFSGTVSDDPAAATMLEYDAWRKEYNKGDFDAKRYEVFKVNFDTITLANEKTGQERREGKTSTTTLIGLNEYADMTEEEFITSTSRTFQIAPLEIDVSSALLSKGDETLDVESDKSNVTINNLGESKLLDTMDGIADDRERIRAAYLDWCKQFSKESDETRFETFSENYVRFETYFKEINFPMKLNKYADLKPDEYKAIVKLKENQIEPKATVEEIICLSPQATVERTPENVKPTVSALESKPKAKTLEKTKQGDLENNIDTKAVSSVQKKTVKEVTPVKITSASASLVGENNTVLTVEEKTEKPDKAITKEASDNNDGPKSLLKPEEIKNEPVMATVEEIPNTKDEEKSLTEPEEVKIDSPKEAVNKILANVKLIASVSKSTPKVVIASEEKDPGYLGNMFDTDVFSSVLKKVVEAVTPVEITPPTRVASKTPPVKVQSEIDPNIEVGDTVTDAFNSLFGVDLKPKIKEPSPKTKPEEKASIPDSNSAFSFFSAPNKKTSESKKELVVPPQDTPPKKAASFSFFGAPEPEQAPSEKATPTPFFNFGQQDSVKTDPPPPVVSKKAPVNESKTNIEVSDVFGSLFGGSKPKAKAEAPTPKAAKAPTTSPKSSFSLFSTQKEPVVTPKAVPVSPPKKAAFSFFETPETEQKAVPAEAPTPAPNPAFSFFSAPAKKTPEPKKEPGNTPKAVVAEKKEAFSFFSPSKSKAISPVSTPAPTPAPVKKVSAPMFSFGKKPAPSVEDTSSAKVGGSGTFSISKALRNGMKTSIAVITEFSQNSDGSITGKVYNTKNFRDGTIITTSPVPRGAKAGAIVTTYSGTKYQLK